MKLFLFVSLILWAIALVSLCSRRDIDVHRKITWVVIVLVLNGLGAVLYLLFGPARHVSEDGTPVDTQGESWNPFIGQNRMGDGKGLNTPRGVAPDSSSTPQRLEH